MVMVMEVVRIYVVEEALELNVKQLLIHNTIVDMFGAAV